LTPDALVRVTTLCGELTRYAVLGDRVIDQTQRRVLNGEQVPAAEKIYSIFESHTDLIKRGKANKPVEFGHKVFLAESASGLITQYKVLEGNPTDNIHVPDSIAHHRTTFGAPPRVVANDRGFYSEDNISVCTEEGVRLVCIPQRGGKKTDERAQYEKSAAFKDGQRFRAGIEGTISVLMRGRGMRRCNARGAEHFAVLVGAAVLTNNLMRIARLLLKKQKSHDRRTSSRSSAA
jgi:IS5 family transposase